MYFLVTASVWGADTPVPANPKTPLPINPIPAFRGDTITLVASNLTLGTAVQLTATNRASDSPATVPITAYPTSATNLAFAVPPALSFGKWELSAPEGVVINSTPATIEIKPRVPTIDSVSPQVLYLPENQKEFAVIGSGFVEDKNDYYLQFLDAPSPVRCGPNTQPAAPSNCYDAAISPDHQQILFSFKDASGLSSVAGKRRFAVAVGGTNSNAADVTFSAVSENTPRYWALAILAGIFLVIYLILRAGEQGVSHEVAGSTYFLTALFLDKQTNTYSLSQCQFYAWTSASILGYIYLAAAKSMIQGSMAFPDIPAGLPGILLASAGTTVLAAGISNSKGNKGAGEIHPSLADFIAAGGVVAAERLQFVVWTIVGVVTFVRLVFLSDPATIDGLPQIPTGFLQLMGISSAGYLGGKLARKAGPTITAVTATADAGVLTLDLKGVGLSQDATFSIGDDVIPPAQIQGDKNLPEIIQKDGTNNEAGFADLLRLKIANPKATWIGANVPVRITNPDQQEAVGRYTVAADAGVKAGAGAAAATGAAAGAGGAAHDESGLTTGTKAELCAPCVIVFTVCDGPSAPLPCWRWPACCCVRPASAWPAITSILSVRSPPRTRPCTRIPPSRWRATAIGSRRASWGDTPSTNRRCWSGPPRSPANFSVFRDSRCACPSRSSPRSPSGSSSYGPANWPAGRPAPWPPRCCSPITCGTRWPRFA